MFEKTREKRNEQKLNSLQDIIDDQTQYIAELEAENENLKKKFEIEQQLGAEVRGLLEDVRKKKNEVYEEYKEAFALQREYRKLIVEIKTMKADYEKELKGIVNGARKEAKKYNV